MRVLCILCLVVGSQVLVMAQVAGKMFPVMVAETVEDKKVNLPADTQGKFTLLGLAYSKKSEDELNTWFNPVYQKFIYKETSGLGAGMSYDVNVYFVPMFTGVNAAATNTAKRKALKNVDPLLLPYILFYKGELKPYKEALDFERRDIPYFFVLDPQGKIVYATSGAYSDAKMDKVEEAIDQ
ncbi:MAG: hypothetical protein K1X47_04890 [Cyclobacteriaceae bacterium]|nr:hypothetical protein [Cyclobacteriaceae bacterium]